MKRVLCIILTLALIVTLIAVPALAVDVGDFAYSENVFDMASSYSFYDDGFDFVSSVPTFTVSDIHSTGCFSFAINFRNFVSFNSVDFYFNFITNNTYVQDVSITFIDLNYDYVTVLGEVQNVLYLSNGYVLYSFYFCIDDSYISGNEFIFDFQYDASEFSDSVLYFSALDFYSYSNDYYVMDFLDIEATASVWNRDDLSYYFESYCEDYNKCFYEPVRLTNDNMSSLPADQQIIFSSGFKAPTGSRYFMYRFYSTGVWPNYYDSGSLTNASLVVIGSAEFSIPFTAEVKQLTFGEVDGLPIYETTIYAELPDIEFTYVYFTTAVNARFPRGNNSDFQLYYFNPIECNFYFDNLNNEDKFINKFINRFSDWYESGPVSMLTTSIGSVSSNIINFFDLVINNIDQNVDQGFIEVKGWLSTIDDHLVEKISDLTIEFNRSFNLLNSNMLDRFKNLFTLLEKYFGVPNGTVPPDTSNQEQKIEDSIGDMDDVADDFSNAGDQIDALLPDTPSYEDTGLAGAADIAGARILELRAVFVVLWDNDFIIQLLTFSCLLALGGFILFGER